MNDLSRHDDERLAETACVFRDLNEEIAAIGRTLTGSELPEFLCECGSPTCTAHVRIDLLSYEAVRSMPLRFVVVPGHDHPETETVVAQSESFVVVEKTAPLGVKLALARNPRRAAPSVPPGGGGSD